MLKLLLAPDLTKENLIGAREKTNETATELAYEEGASVMTTTRLINSRKEGGLVEFAPYLRIVKRRRLAQRWRAAYAKLTVGVSM